jgi:hypothetical protein
MVMLAILRWRSFDESWLIFALIYVIYRAMLLSVGKIISNNKAALTSAKG